MKKKVLLLLLLLCVVLFGAVGALFVTDIGTGLVGRTLVEQAQKHLGAALAFQELQGNPLRGYTVQDLHLSKGERNLLRVHEGLVRLRLLPLLRKSFEIDKFELRDFEVSPKNFSYLEAIPKGALDSLDSVKGRRFHVRQRGNEISLSGELDYGTIPLKGEGTLNIPLAMGKSDFLKSLELLESKVFVGEIASVSAKGPLYPAMDITGDLESLGIEKVLSLLGVSVQQAMQIPVNATFRCVKDPGPDQVLRAAGKVLLPKGALGGIPLGESRCDFTWNGQVLGATIPSFVLGAIPFKGQGVYKPFEGSGGTVPGWLSLSMGAENVNVAELKEMLPKLPEGMNLGGSVKKGTIVVQGKNGVFQGDVQIDAPLFTFGDESLKDVKIQVKLREKNILYITSRAQGWGGAMSLSGSGSFPGPQLDLSFSTKGVRLERLVKLIPSMKSLNIRGDVNNEGTIRGALGSLVVDEVVSSPKVALNDVFVDAIRVPLRFYQKEGRLSIQKGSAKMGHGHIQLQGDFTDLTGKTPRCSGALESQGMALESLGSIHPSLKGLPLKGNLTLKTAFEGPLSSPSVQAVVYIPTLTLPEKSQVHHLKGETSLRQEDMTNLVEGKSKSVGFTLSAKDLQHSSGLVLENPKLDMSYDMAAQTLIISRLQSFVGQAPLEGKGEFVFKNPSGQSNFTFDIKGDNLDASRIYRTAQGKNPLQGLVNLECSGKGTFESPQVTLFVSSPGINYETFAMKDVQARGEGNLKTFRLNEAQGNLYGGVLKVSGKVLLQGEEPSLDFNATLQNLNLEALGRDLPALGKLQPQGMGSGNFVLRGPLSDISGEGNASVPELHLFGLRATHVKMPLSLHQGAFRIASGKADLYEGNLNTDFKVTFPKGDWKTQVKGQQISMGPLLRDLTLSDKGLFCNGNLDFNGGGNFPSGKMQGQGSFVTSEGYLLGLPWVDLVAKLYGSDRVRFQKIFGDYEVDSKRFLLRHGEAEPVQGDPLYRALTASGPVSYAGPLDIAVEGLLNVQLVNAIMGGTTGAIGGLIQNPGSLEGLLQGVLGGVEKRGSSADFRKVSFTLAGTAKKPEMKNFRAEKIQENPQEIGIATPVTSMTPEPTPKPLVQEIVEELTQKNPGETVGGAEEPGVTPEPKNVEDVIKEKVEEKVKEEIFKLFE